MFQLRKQSTEYSCSCKVSILISNFRVYMVLKKHGKNVNNRLVLGLFVKVIEIYVLENAFN